MDLNQTDYDGIFARAKDSTVYSHAIVWVQNIMDDKKKSDKDKFSEILRLMNEAVNHLSIYE